MDKQPISGTVKAIYKKQSISIEAPFVAINQKTFNPLLFIFSVFSIYLFLELRFLVTIEKCFS